jgi:oxygen-dependent protoporphyrinogen oxidase
METTDLDVAVVGAGAAGLATAYRLQRAGRTVQVFEAAEQVGGRMRTHRHNGFRIDTGAEIISTRGYPATWKLIREVGLSDRDLVRIRNPVAMWRGRRAHPHVGRRLAELTGGGLSLQGRVALRRFKARAAEGARTLDPDHPEKLLPLDGMTVAHLAGGELYDYLLQPTVGGLFGWDARRSAAASLMATLTPTGSSTNWRTYVDGMDTLTRRLADCVPVVTGSPVREVVSVAASARVVTDAAVVTPRAVVLAVPAPAALELHRNMPEDERRFVEASTFVPRLKVSCLLDRPLVPRGSRSAYVVLIPEVEDRDLSVIMLDHNKCRTRAPEGRGLVTMLASPAATAELLDAPDEIVVAVMTDRAERFLPGLRAATNANFVYRFALGIPEATPAAVALRGDFLRRPVRSVDYAGDWAMLRPSSEGAVRSADLAAERVLAHAWAHTGLAAG